MSVRNRKHSPLWTSFSFCRRGISNLLSCPPWILGKILRCIRKRIKWVLIFTTVALIVLPLHLLVSTARPTLEPGEHELLLVTNNLRLGSSSTLQSPAVIIGNPIGGIGNQLFEYACAYSLARTLNTDLYLRVPKRINSTESLGLTPTARTFGLENFNINFTRPEGSGAYLLDSNLPLEEPEEREILDYIYGIRKFDESARAAAPARFINIRLYCESEVYFKPYKEEIVEMFQFAPSSLDMLLTPGVKLLLEDIRAPSNDSVGVHIRRGDFMTVGGNFYRVLPPAYYTKAIDLMNQRLTNPKFYVFTDDLAYAQRVIGQKPNVVYVSSVTTNSSLQDFLSMTKCRHLILANSSFSWWAAYLNSSVGKIVIAPFPKYREWYMNAKYKFLEKYYLVPTFYPAEWETINPWE